MTRKIELTEAVDVASIFQSMFTVFFRIYAFILDFDSEKCRGCDHAAVTAFEILKDSLDTDEGTYSVTDIQQIFNSVTRHICDRIKCLRSGS